MQPLAWFVLCPLGNGRTELRLEQRGRLSADGYRRATDGWSSFLDRVAARLVVG